MYVGHTANEAVDHAKWKLITGNRQWLPNPSPLMIQKEKEKKQNTLTYGGM